MAEVWANDWSGRLTAELSNSVGAGGTIAVAPDAPAATVGNRVRARIGTEIVTADVTTATSWTVVAREAEDADRYPKGTWPAGTAVDLVLTSAGLAALVGQTAAPALTGNMLTVDAVNGADATALPGRADRPYLTLAAAKAAATDETVQVRPGAYAVAESVVKAGVNWDFEAGATVTRSDGGAGNVPGVIDDGGAAMTVALVGAAVFTRTLAVPGATSSVVRTTHASSDVSIRCRSLLCAAGNLAATVYGVSAEAGRLYVETDFIGSESTTGTVYGVWWANGDMHVRAGRIAAAGFVTSTGVYSTAASAPTGEAFVSADEIVAPTAILQNGGNASAAMWVRALVVRCADAVNGNAVLVLGNNRLYVEAQKTFGRVRIAGGAGLTYIRHQKWSAIANGTPSAPGLLGQGASTGLTIIDVQDADPAGFTGDMFRVTGGGTIEIRGMWYVANAGSAGLEITAGTVRLINCHIDTSANSGTNPIVKSGGTLELVDCTLVAEGTRNSIEAASAQTVDVRGYVHSNRPVHVNVTLQALAERFP